MPVTDQTWSADGVGLGDLVAMIFGRDPGLYSGYVVFLIKAAPAADGLPVVELHTDAAGPGELRQILRAVTATVEADQ